MTDLTPTRFDVLVAGGAAAGLCAAIAARLAGASVRLVEAAPEALRGGNTRHARNFRIAHAGPAPYVPDSYRPEEFLADLLRVTGGDTDEPLARTLIRASAGIAPWLLAAGVRLQALDRGVLPYSRRTAFLLGGGKAMVNALYATAEALGVVVSYDTTLVDLRPDDGDCAVVLDTAAGRESMLSRAVVVATGGHQADLAQLRVDLGPAADRLVVRGSQYCTGHGLDLLLGLGAEPVGDRASAHLVAVDARGPRFDGGIVTRMTGIPHGIVVDRTGRRLADERADTRRTHYAQWGPRIAACPDQLAYLIVDQDGLRRVGPTALAPVTAPSVAELARRLEIDPASLDATVRTFNAEAAEREPAVRPLAALPLAAWPLLPGLTFTHFGVAVDTGMRVRLRGGRRSERVFAAGTTMAANVLRHGYLAGLGLTLAAVSGRIAGEEAARAAA